MDTTTANASVSPIRASTQDHLSIEDIMNDIVILKDGSCALLLSVSAVNFDLLSEREQDAIIYAYGALLNSLTFSIQIVIRSQKKDISSYVELLEKEEIRKQTDPLLSKLIGSYRKFIAETVKHNNVLDKKFYVIIPFSSLELGVSSSFTSMVKRSTSLPFPKDYIVDKAKIALYPKRDHVARLFARIGLVTKQLNTQQLVKLFYEIYNNETYRLALTVDK